MYVVLCRPTETRGSVVTDEVAVNIVIDVWINMTLKVLTVYIATCEWFKLSYT